VVDRFSLERVYEERGLIDYKLRNLDDLFYIYGVKLNQVQGYSNLEESDKVYFNRFVINYFNSHGLCSCNISIIKVFKINDYLRTELLENGEWKAGTVKL
jgi:hypothetical protein